MPDKYTVTRFNKAPMLGKSRTRFDLSHDFKTTFETGDFVPILVEPVFPGDTFSLRTLSLTRLETSLHQTMDNVYIEFAYFFVPYLQVYPDFDKFMGANDDPWAQTGYDTLPQLYLEHNSIGSSRVFVQPMSLLNQLGVPVGYYGHTTGQAPDKTTSLSIDLCVLRSVFKCYNDWYRDENFDSIIYYSDDGTDKFANDTYLYNGTQLNVTLPHALKVNRFKDVFSTALPAPQKGQDTFVNIVPNSLVPVVTGAEHDVDGMSYGMLLRNRSDGSAPSAGLVGVDSYHSLSKSDVSGGNISGQLYPSNLYTDLSDAAIVTINQLRLAIVRQAMKERDARGGTRMNEQIANIFDINVNSLEIGRSEFLGGKRVPIRMLEVIQTSETGSTVLGTDAGHSKTLDASDSFLKSFTQYGYLLGFAYTRAARSYSQGLDRKLCAKTRFDMLDPMLDNIGEVPILKKELYALDSNFSVMDSVFGYQEQYYWLKERTNRMAGYMQTGITGTMDSYHYGDYYNGSPFLSASWLKEERNNVDRTIAVQNSHQWTLDVHFELYATRCLKKYSIPNTFGF